MKIDVFAHVLTPRYLRERNARAGGNFASQYAKYWSANPGLTDLDIRVRILDRCDLHTREFLLDARRVLRREIPAQLLEVEEGDDLHRLGLVRAKANRNRMLVLRRVR